MRAPLGGGLCDFFNSQQFAAQRAGAAAAFFIVVHYLTRSAGGSIECELKFAR